MLHLTLEKQFTSFPEETLKQVKSQYGLRRADRFTLLAATALKLAFPDRFPSIVNSGAGLITVSSFGPYKTVFATLDDILDYPEDQILPTKFSHSVHNAVTSYLGTILKITGPAFAITNFESPQQEALSLAETLLDTGMCNQILIVAVEEQGFLTEKMHPLWLERYQTPPPPEAVSVFLANSQP